MKGDIDKAFKTLMDGMFIKYSGVLIRVDKKRSGTKYFVLSEFYDTLEDAQNAIDNSVLRNPPSNHKRIP